MGSVIRLAVLLLTAFFFLCASGDGDKKKIIIYVPQTVKVIHHKHKVVVPVKGHHGGEESHSYIGEDHHHPNHGGGDESYWGGKGFGGWHEYGNGESGGHRGYSAGHNFGGGISGIGHGHHSSGSHGFGGYGGGHSFGFGSSASGSGGFGFSSGDDHEFGSHSELHHRRYKPGGHHSVSILSLAGHEDPSTNRGVKHGFSTLDSYGSGGQQFGKSQDGWYRNHGGWQESVKPTPYSGSLSDTKGDSSNSWPSITGSVEVGIGGKWYDLKGREISRGKRFTSRPMQIGHGGKSFFSWGDGKGFGMDYGNGYSVKELGTSGFGEMNWQ